jgi:hypothetical protein
VSGQGLVRTFFVFLDLPEHVEFRAGDLPLLREGDLLDFDLRIKPPKGKEVSVSGQHAVNKRILRFSNSKASSSGLTQYLELEKV